MNRQMTTMLDHENVDERSEESYRAGPGRLGDRLAERQAPVPRRVLRPLTAEDDEYTEQGGEGSFLRSQTRIRVRRGVIPESRWGRILAGLGLLAAVAALVAAMLVVRNYLLHDQRFFIDSSSEIQINGNSHVSRPQLLSIFGEDIGRNLFRVPLAERRTVLEQLPWVEHATVMRLLPNRLRVNVVERTPVAFVRQGARIGLADAYGVLLELPADEVGGAKYSFPVLTGIAAEEPLSTRAARMKIYVQFMKELDSGGVKISDTLSEVDVSNPDDVKALIPDHSSEILVHFGDEDYLARYQRYQQQLPGWRAQYPNLASVDMRYQNQVVLDMAPGSGGQVTQPAGQPGSAGETVSPQGGMSVPAAPPSSDGGVKKAAGTPVAAVTAAAPAAKTAQPSAKTASAVKTPVKATAVKTPTKTAVVKAPAKAAPVKAPAKAVSAAVAPVGAPAVAPVAGYSTQHPLTKAFDVPAKKSAVPVKKTAAAKAPAKAKAKAGAKAKPGVVKSKKALVQ